MGTSFFRNLERMVGKFRNRKKILKTFFSDKMSEIRDINIDPVLKSWSAKNECDWFRALEAEQELKSFLVLAAMHYLMHRKSDRARQGFAAEYITCEGQLLSLWLELIQYTSVYRDIMKVLCVDIDYWPESTDQRLSQPRAYNLALTLYQEIHDAPPKDHQFWPPITEVCHNWKE